MRKDKRNVKVEAAQPEAAQPEAVQPEAAQPTTVLTYRREHPGNQTSYVVAGRKGIVNTPSLSLPFPRPLTIEVSTSTPFVGGSTLSYGAFAPKSNRHSYTSAGCPGVWHIDATTLEPSATLYLSIVLVGKATVAARVQNVTSAIVAGGNVAQAAIVGTAIASPAEVAAIASNVVDSIVTSASIASGKGNAASVLAAFDKAHASKVS